MVLQLQVWGLLLLQEATSAAPVGFDPITMWKNMGWQAKAIVIILFFMSAWSIGVMIDRLIAYNGAIDSEDNARPIKVAEYVKNDSIKKYVEDAVAAAKKGEDPKVASRDPYGCSLKY